MDDYSSDHTTTGTLQLGTASRGAIETVDDTDWFAVNLVAGASYRFFLKGVWGEPRGSEVGQFLRAHAVKLLDPDMTVVASYDGDSYPSRSNLEYRPLESGVFHFEVGGSIGSYSLEVFEQAEETGHTRADALSLSLSVPMLLENDPRTEPDPSDPDTNVRVPDEDWLNIDLQAGTSYVMELWRSPFEDVSFPRMLLEVTAPSGNTVAQATDVQRAAEFHIFSAMETGTYSIKSTGSIFQTNKAYRVALYEGVDIEGTAGNDWLTVPGDQDKRLISVSGGAGQDMISFASHNMQNGYERGVSVNLDTGRISASNLGSINFEMQGIEHATGSVFADSLHGHDGAERLRGLSGDDLFFGSSGADRIDGGSGVDVMDFGEATTAVSASLLRGRGWSGDAAGDRYAGIENLSGSRQDDILWGDHRDNELSGSYGDDTLIGNGGNDEILAGHGHDVIVFSGNQADYSVRQLGIRTIVTDTVGGDGRDTILHAEVLRFADGDLLL